MVGDLVVDMIGGVVYGTRGCSLQLAHCLVSGGKKSFELGPGLVRWIPSFPQLAIVIENSSLEYQLICDAEDLQRGVRGITCRSVLDDAFNLID